MIYSRYIKTNILASSGTFHPLIRCCSMSTSSSATATATATVAKDTNNKDNYTHGHHKAVVSSHARRTAEEYAPRTIELIKPGMQVLDVGCGPGSITAGFMKYLQGSGSIVATDVEKDVLKQAQQFLDEEKDKLKSKVSVKVEDGSVYALKYGDKSFDVVHAHQVLQHLSDPVLALKEMKRVSKKYVTVRDVDYETWVWYPRSPMMDKWKDVYRNVCRKNKAEPEAGKFYRKCEY